MTTVRPQPSILVAEDNPVNQLVTRKILEGVGCAVTLAATGLEAVALACERRFDLILMDLHMPQLDGLEATRTIRAFSAYRPVVIACTAHVSPQHRAECRAAGMDDFLGKPVHKEDLERTVGHWLDVAVAQAGRSESSGIAGRLEQLIADTDEDFVREIAVIFIRTGKELLQAAADGVTRGDQVMAVRAIHSLKGAAGNVGAAELMSRCGEIEHKGRDGNLEHEEIVELRILFGMAEAEIASALSRRGTNLTAAGAA